MFYLLYWGCCLLGTGSDEKNLRSLRSYPDEVQRAVQNDPRLAQRIPAKKPLPAILLGNLIFFTAAFFVLGITLKGTLGLDSFRAAFWYFLAFGEGLGLFDLLVIDLLWWRNAKRIRFSFLPEKKLYQSPKEHIASFVRGIPLFAAAAALSAAIVTAVPL